MSIFVVIGAKGGTGREIVKSLLARSPAEVSAVRAVVRDPSSVPAGAFPTGDNRLTVVTGDCTQPDSLPLDGGVHTLFFVAAGKGYAMSEAVDRCAPRDVGKAAAAAGVGRVVLVSSQLVDASQGNKHSAVRGVLNTINTGLFRAKGMMDFKYEGEQFLKSSGASWTILRPGRLGDGAAGSAGALAVAQGVDGSFCPGSIVPRSDLGALAVEAALSARCAGTTLEVGTKGKEAPAQAPGPGYLDGLFETLRAEGAK